MNNIIILIVTFFYFSNSSLTQPNSPSAELQGKWISNKLGIDISESSITLLLKKQNWKLSEKINDKIYFIESPKVNEANVYEGWGVTYFKAKVTQDAASDSVEILYKWVYFRIEIKKNNVLKFSLSKPAYTKYENKPQLIVPIKLKEEYEEYGCLSESFKLEKL